MSVNIIRQTHPYKKRTLVLVLLVSFFFTLFTPLVTPYLKNHVEAAQSPATFQWSSDGNTIQVTGPNLATKPIAMQKISSPLSTAGGIPITWVNGVVQGFKNNDNAPFTFGDNSNSPTACLVTLLVEVNIVGIDTTKDTKVKSVQVVTDSTKNGSSQCGQTNGTNMQQFEASARATTTILGSSSAAPTTAPATPKIAAWINHSVIQVDGNYYIDHQIDDHLIFSGDSGCDGNPNGIKGFPNTDGNNTTNANGGSKTQLSTSSDDPQGNCQPVDSKLSFGDQNNFNTYFWWGDQGTIATSDGTNSDLGIDVNSAGFVFSNPAPVTTGPNIYTTNGGSNFEAGGCQSTISATLGQYTGTLVIRRSSSSSPLQTGWDAKYKNVSIDGQGCYASKPITIAIGNALQASTKSPGDSLATDKNKNQNSTFDCSVSLTNPLTWIECPIIDTASKLVHTLDKDITDQLTIDTGKYLDANACNNIPGRADSDKCTASGPHFYQVWSVFRNLAMAILVIAGLVMVISQAFGSGPFDAYTVKRVMPRIILAVIFMAISWQILKLAVDFFNVLGRGAEAVIASPFNSLPNPKPSSGALTIGGLGLVGLGLSLGPLGILGLVMMAALAVIVALATIVVRNILVLLLIMVSPIAIACFILPNTQRIWKIWSDQFIRALAVFPIITAFIATGRVFAKIAPSSDLGGIIAFVAYFGPYFMLPMAFRLAGGAIAGVNGAIKSRTSGISKFGGGLVKKSAAKRGQKWEERRQRAGSETLFNPNNRVVKKLRLNKAASWATKPGANVAYYGRNVPGLSGRGQKIKSQIEGATISQTGKAYEELNAAQFNDKAYRALSGAYALSEDEGGFSETTRGKLQTAGFMDSSGRTLRRMDSLKNIQEMAGILEGGSTTEASAANVLRGSAGRVLSMYSDPEMGKASVQGAGLIGLSAHGFADGKDLASVGNDLMGQGSSPDLTQALVNAAQVSGQRQRPDIKAGYGTVYKNGKFVDGMSAEGGRARSLIKTLSVSDLAAAKGGAIKKLADTIHGVLGDGGDEALAVKDQLFSWAGPYSQASVGVKKEALTIIRDNGLQQEFEDRRSADTDPTRRNQGGSAGEPEE